MIPDAAFRETVAIVGRTGSGKTYAARGQVERLLEQGDRVCIIDPTGVWHGLRASADGKSPGFAVAVFGGMHADVPIGEGNAYALAELIAERNLPAIIDISEQSKSAQRRFAAAFFERLYETNKKPLTLVLDEADEFAPQKPARDDLALLNRLNLIVRRGRVRGFKPWLITQRPAVLHKDVLSQASTLICMKLTSPQDRAAIGAWIEGQADREAGKALLADLPKLSPGTGYVWCPALDYLERVEFPPITTYDSGRTPEHGEERQAPESISALDPGLVEALREEIDGERTEYREVRDPRGIDEIEAELARAREESYRDGYRDALAEVRPIIDMHMQAALDSMRARLDTMKPTGFLPHRERVYTTDNEGTQYGREVDAEWSPPTRTPPPKVNGSALLPKAEQRALAVLAQYPNGRTRAQIAIMAGYAVNGGGFRNTLSALRTKGYATGTDPLVITPDGVLAAGFVPKLPTGRALLEHWYAQLGKAERKALESLADAYPRKLSRVQIANLSGYDADGGGFRNALSKLRTLGLIKGTREIAASPEFFT
jgi:hypothetical protein